MKRSLVVGMAAIALCGCGRGRPGPQQATATTTTDSAEAMTIVGCLVPAGAPAESRAVGTAGNQEPPSFTLVNVVGPPPGSGARSYDLVAGTDRLDDLQRFANSRVEVRGSIVASTGTGASDAGAASGPVGAPPTDVRRLRVTDVRQIEPTCGVTRKD